MKTILLTFLLLPLSVYAQKIDLKDVDADSESTTIQISKGNKKQDDKTSCSASWEVVDGSNDIEGEPATMIKDAKASWKKACDDWKKEFRQDNKDNKIITINCGSASCSSDAGGKVCTSKATYKVKTRLD